MQAWGARPELANCFLAFFASLLDGLIVASEWLAAPSSPIPTNPSEGGAARELHIHSARANRAEREDNGKAARH